MIMIQKQTILLLINDKSVTDVIHYSYRITGTRKKSHENQFHVLFVSSGKRDHSSFRF